MNRINRRRFVAVTSVTATSALLVACGNSPATEEQLSPTQIPDVPGAPPTLAPITSSPGTEATPDAPDDSGTAAPGGEALVITMHDNFSFEPNQPEVFPGQTITVTNEGFMQHDLVSDDLGIGTALLNPGESEDIVVPDDAAVGESFHFICTVAGHEQSGMVGDFHIVEAGAAAPSEEEGAEEEDADEDAPAEEGAGAPAEALTITMHDSFSFEPNQPEVSPGQTITVLNEGFMQHDLVSDDLGIGTELLNAGETQEIVIPEDATVGESYHFICTVAGHEQSGMVGDFIIVEGGGSAAPADEEAPAEEESAEEEAPEDESAAGTPAEALTITMHDNFSFEPNQPEVSPGQTITVLNEGFMQHDLVSNDLGIGTALLNAGESEDIVIPEDAAVGEQFHFICTVAGHEQSGMVGDFIIVEGSAAAPAGDDESAEEEEAPAEYEEAAESTPVADNTPLATTVVGTLWEFSPAEFEIAPGGVITFQNDTDMQMGLSADEWDANAMTPMIRSVAPGATGEFTVPEDAEIGATVEFKSNLTEAENQGMVGTITIVAADGAGATPVADATPENGDADAGDAVVVEAADNFSFTPNLVEVSPGQTVTLVNQGFMQHDLVCEDLDIGTALLNHGESEDIVIPDDATVGETYHFICTVAGHEQSGMVGDFVIV